MLVRELASGAPALSDVAVAADSGGVWTPGAGIRLRPSPAHLTGADGVGYVYFEVYNLTPGGQYTDADPPRTRGQRLRGGVRALVPR